MYSNRGLQSRRRISSAQGRETRRRGAGDAEEDKNMIHYQNKEITREIVLSAIAVHKALRPGLLESTYKACLLVEFQGADNQIGRVSCLNFPLRPLRPCSAFRGPALMK